MDLIASLVSVAWEFVTRRHRIEVRHSLGRLPNGTPVLIVQVRNAGRTPVWVQAAGIDYAAGYRVVMQVTPTRLEADGPWSTFPAAGAVPDLDLTSPSTAWVQEPSGRLHTS